MSGRWFGGRSFQYFNFDDLDSTSDFEIQLKFRTSDPDGLLLWAGSDHIDKTSKALSLLVLDGELELSYGEEKIKDPKAINDLLWHQVIIKYNRGALSMTVDQGANHYVSFRRRYFYVKNTYSNTPNLQTSIHCMIQKTDHIMSYKNNYVVLC